MDKPIVTAHLFGELNEHLVRLLQSLGPDDWNRPTVCSLWSVKDIASHLLDGNIRRLAAQRDGYRPPDAPATFASHADLMGYLNRLNAEWTRATKRLSPRTLIELLELTGIQIADLFEAAEPLAPATFPVGWAGESESKMWFDIAREYTERWHHQRQIADAVSVQTPIDQRRLYHPVLETFLRALPYSLRNAESPNGTVVSVRVTGDAGGEWLAIRSADAWIRSAGGQPTATLIMPQQVAWKALTKRWDADKKLRSFPGITLEGDERLARSALAMVSIMA